MLQGNVQVEQVERVEAAGAGQGREVAVWLEVAGAFGDEEGRAACLAFKDARAAVCREVALFAEEFAKVRFESAVDADGPLQRLVIGVDAVVELVVPPDDDGGVIQNGTLDVVLSTRKVSDVKALVRAFGSDPNVLGD